jgi:DeoR/GlpR family transcriptional regulator of sugar metabolism
VVVTVRDPGRDVFAVERRETIWRLVSERGRVRTSELAQLLQVTEPTIRKDIGDLQTQGLLIRTHGGAVARRSMAEVGLSQRAELYVQEKRSIAETCVDLIADAESVYLDGGSTADEIAQVLAARSRSGAALADVKVLTTSLRVAEICGSVPGEGAILLGGRYRAASATTVGPLTLAALGQFRVDIAFLGVTGITADGFSVSDLGEAQVKREVIARAARSVVPMDHHKVGLSDFVTVCPLDQVHTVVTDRADADLGDWLEESAVELLVAGPAGADPRPGPPEHPPTNR